MDKLRYFRWYSVMYKKFSYRLPGGMADSWYGALLRHNNAVELHRIGGENCSPGMHSEKPRKSNGEFVDNLYLLRAKPNSIN